jgi:hypothetical protein
MRRLKLRACAKHFIRTHSRSGGKGGSGQESLARQLQKPKPSGDAKDEEKMPLNLFLCVLRVLCGFLGCESARGDRAQNFLRRGQVSGLLFGEHQLAIGKYIQHPAATQTQLYFFHSGLGFQFALQAPGLTANVGSKETALDLNFHDHYP